MASILVNSSIKLNLSRPNSGVVVYAKQFDKDSRVIDIELLNGSESWDPPQDCSIVVMYAKPDGKVGIYDTLEDNETSAIERISEGKIRLTLAEQALTVAGNVMVEISFFTAVSRSTTLSFVISVEKGVPRNEVLESDNYFNILTQLIQGLLGAISYTPIIDSETGNWMLWDEFQNEYVDSGYPSRGEQGAAGVITVTPSVMYAVGDDDTTAPSSGWTGTKPTVPQGKYLWARVRLTFGDGTYANVLLTTLKSVSVTNIENVSVTHQAGETDTYAFRLGDGTLTNTFSVYNGKDGDGVFIALGSVELSASGWVSHTGYYTQACTMQQATIGALSKIAIQPDVNTIIQLRSDGVVGMYIENNNGSLTAYSIGAAPSVDITLQCSINEVK